MKSRAVGPVAEISVYRRKHVRKGRGHNVDRRIYCLCVTVVGM